MVGLASLVTGAALSVAAVVANAAVIANPVTSITTSPTNPKLTDPVRTDVAWCVPDSATAGDTFTIALPPELTQLPRGFALRDPNGVVVANATIQGTPATATFTFNDYVDTHINVCGHAFFESRLSSSVSAGNSYTLRYVVNGTTNFDQVITVAPGGTTTGRDTSHKGAFFGDPTDECREAATDCIAWYVESPIGPFQSVTINDNATADVTFDCAKLTVTLWSVDANGNISQSFSPASQGATVQPTCSATGFSVVVNNVPANRLVRAVIRATPTALVPDGGVLFTNVATVTHVSSTTGSVTETVNGQRRSARVGGDANGVTLPPTTTTIAASTTTSSLPAVLPPVPTTTTVPEFASSPVLPATGSDHSGLLLAGMAFLATGAVLTAASRRRGRTI
jgi:LPXTG-motif cell wall-anchored protein